MEFGFRIPIVRGIPDSLRYIFRVPKPRIPDSSSQNLMIPESGIPLLGREVTLSGNLRTKREYILCGKLSSTI